MKGRASSSEISRRISQEKHDPKFCNHARSPVTIMNSITLLPDTYSCPPHISSHEVCGEGSEDEDTIPNFTISDNLGSTESAQELRHLIDAMKIEFLRLRNSKLQAEDRAARLQTNLIFQQRQMEKSSMALRAENEHLKAVANARDKNLEQAMKTINQLEDEIRILKGKKERRKKNDRDRVGPHEKSLKRNTSD